MVILSNMSPKNKKYELYYSSQPETILFSGSRTACIKYLKSKNLFKLYKNGKIKLGYTIWAKNN